MTPHSPFTPDQLEAALAQLRAGQALDQFSLDPEFQAALRLHVATSNPAMKLDSAARIEHRLLQQFGQEKPQSKWQQWLRPVLVVPAGGLVAVGILAVIVLQRPNTDSVQVAQESPSDQTTTSNKNTNSTTDTGAATAATTKNTTGTDSGLVGDDNQAAPNSVGSSNQNTNTDSKTDSDTVLAAVASSNTDVAALQVEIDKTLSELTALLDQIDAASQAETDFSDLTI